MRLLECDASAILLGEGNGSKLRYAVSLGPKGFSLQKGVVDRHGISGWVFENNVPVIIDDVASDFRFSSTEQAQSDYIFHTLLAYRCC